MIAKVLVGYAQVMIRRDLEGKILKRRSNGERPLAWLDGSRRVAQRPQTLSRC